MPAIPVFIQYPFVDPLTNLKVPLEETNFFNLYLVRFDTDLLELLADSLPCILILSVRDSSSRKDVKQLLETFQKALERHQVPFRHPGLRILVLAEKEGVIFESWFRLGVQDFIITPMQPRDFVHKMARHFYKAMSYLDPETINLRPSKEIQLTPTPGTEALPREAEVEWRNFVVPSTRPEPPQKSVISKYQIEVETTEFNTKNGSWVLSKDQEDGFEEIWEWQPTPQRDGGNITPTPPQSHKESSLGSVTVIKSDVKDGTKSWKFKGDKPEFSTKQGVWLFKGEKPKLWRHHYNAKKEDLKDTSQIFIEVDTDHNQVSTRSNREFKMKGARKQYFAVSQKLPAKTAQKRIKADEQVEKFPIKTLSNADSPPPSSTDNSLANLIHFLEDWKPVEWRSENKPVARNQTPQSKNLDKILFDTRLVSRKNNK